MNRRKRISAVVAALFSIVVVGPVARASHSEFGVGDLFVAAGSSTVQWRHADGSPNRSLTTFVNSPSTAGMVFDLSGKLYVTGFTSNGISRFLTSGAQDGAFGGSYSSHPRSMAVDAAGNLYVGLAGGSKRILKMTTEGSLLASYAVPISGSGGADWIDLAADQCTLLYTNRGPAVKRFNACTGAPLADLNGASLPATAHEVRALLDGGALVANTSAIRRIARGGSVAQTYDVAGQDCWQNVTLGTTTSTFWASDNCTSNVYEFDMATGSVLRTLPGVSRRGTVQGLAVFGGLRAATAGADLAVTKTTEFEQVTSGGTVRYEITVRNNGPLATAGVSVTDTPSHGTITSSSGTGWSCEIAVGGGSATCARAGALAAAEAAPALELLVEAPTVGEQTTLRNTATVSGDEPDPAAANNTAVTETTILDAQSSENAVITYCGPSGCQLETAYDTNDPTNNTGNQVVVPGGGRGGLTTLIEGATTFPCSANATTGDDVEGQETLFDPPPGLNDFTNPIQVITRYHNSLVGPGETVLPLCMSKDGGATSFEVPPCANPSWAVQDLGNGQTAVGPCIKKVQQLGQGNTNLDWQVHMNMLSVDPQWRR